MRYLIATMIIVATGAEVRAQNVPYDQVVTAELEMISRSQSAIEAYAREIGASPPILTYCRIELAMRTANQPSGMMPFGIDYRRIPAMGDMLNRVLSTREAYETSFLRICLANAVKTLRAVEQR